MAECDKLTGAAKKLCLKKNYKRPTELTKKKQVKLSLADRRKSALASKRVKDSTANAASLKKKRDAIRKKMDRPTTKKISDAAKKVTSVFKKKTPAQKESNKKKKIDKKLNRKMTGNRWNAKWN